MKSKVLIAAYYWPPAGGPGVQRWLKFAQYLPEFDWEPILYVPENPSYPVTDKSLLNEVPTDLKVIKTKIWEPYALAEKINPGNKKYKAGQFETHKEQSLLAKLSVYVRGNYFIPDARKFWVKPSVKFLRDFLKKEGIQTLITTGPPHSLHLIGLKLKKENPDFKWIADFRDPWTQISYHSQLKLTERSKKKHRELEKEVLKTADCVIATSFTDAVKYRKAGAKRVEVITNGFEEKDFQDLNKKGSDTEYFTLTYSGGLEAARNPRPVWEALEEIIREDDEFAKEFKLEFFGNLSEEVKKSILTHGLKNNLIERGYVSHKEAVEGICTSELLLLTNFPDEKSKGIIPGKLFEYIATGNPILAIGPKDGDVGRILEEKKGGRYFDYSQKEEIKEYILQIRNEWKSGERKSYPIPTQFSRRNLTKKLAEVLDGLDA